MDVQICHRRGASRARRVRGRVPPDQERRNGHSCPLVGHGIRHRLSAARRHQRAIRAAPSRWDEPLDYARLMPKLMAFFKRKEKVPAEVERLDWKLLERGAVALYHKGSVLSQDLARLRGERYVIHELDAVSWKEPSHFHD